MKLIVLAIKSALNRRLSIFLAVVSIAIGIFLLVSVDKIRKETKNSFVNTISKTDLIVGARTSPINLLLYSVFRIGRPVNNISYATYRELSALPEVKWTIPISLGDSHRGYRVMGTSGDYFKHYQYGDGQPMVLQNGDFFNGLFQAVIGSDVARELNYQVGEKIILTHGVIDSSLAAQHDDHPFEIVGVLSSTGTPVDRTIHVSLESIEAIHLGWESGTPLPIKLSPEIIKTLKLQPQSITAFMAGLQNRAKIFKTQRVINQFKQEAIMGIIPGVELTALWRTIGQFERVLFVILALVLLSSLITILATLISTLNQRRREMAILRALGIRAYQIFLLFIYETTFILAGGIVGGVALFYLISLPLQSLLISTYGIHLPITFLDTEQLIALFGYLLVGILASTFPALMAYRKALKDGLTVML